MAKLCKAGQQLREQIDDDFPGRDRRSDGWIADARHRALSKTSDHIPDPKTGIVRAIDIDANLNDHPEAVFALVEQIRKCAKRGDKRIKYVIHNGRIASSIMNWKWRKYRGPNPHISHFHCSFTTLGDNNGKWFDLEGNRDVIQRPETSGSDLDQDIHSRSSSSLPIDGLGCCCNCKCCTRQRPAQHHQLA